MHHEIADRSEYSATFLNRRDNGGKVVISEHNVRDALCHPRPGDTWNMEDREYGDNDCTRKENVVTHTHAHTCDPNKSRDTRAGTPDNSPIAIPTSASLIAGESLTPSPVIATMRPRL
jgi:hypothetical protein